MNLVDCYVVELLSKPFFEESSGCWGVEVSFNSYGTISKSKIFFDTEKEANKVKKGYKFLN